MTEGGNSLLWFRKGLRLHDNPALLEACKEASHLYCIFILDPWFLAPDPTAPSPGSTRVGLNRINFLLESLTDLDTSLRNHGSRLLVLSGDPKVVIPQIVAKWGITKLCFEFDTEPYALERDEIVREAAKKAGVEVHDPVSHTLYHPADIIAKNKGKVPLTYQAFSKLLPKAPLPVEDPPEKLPSTPEDLAGVDVSCVPSVKGLGYDQLPEDERTPFRGGETEALQRMDNFLAQQKRVAEFEKPKGDPTAFLEPATTVLSPYLKFGCLSCRLFHQRLMAVYAANRAHSKPPVSLEGQLLWREFFYTAGFGVPNFDRMVGNTICKQIPWREDAELLAAWRDARTGYPWIDAAMTQLHKWGWMHHLARHAVACFLTRGDMMVHWEKGRDVFDRLLIDADWSVNNANWMWLSCSAFFAQFHRIYSPITFPKKYDKEGKYVKFFLPVLKDMPSAYIYEPWTAPLEVQKTAKCIIGQDYPRPVIDHATANKLCRDRMGAAFAINKNGPPSQEELVKLRTKLYGPPTGENTGVAKEEKKNSRLREAPGNGTRSGGKRQRKLTDY